MRISFIICCFRKSAGFSSWNLYLRPPNILCIFNNLGLVCKYLLCFQYHWVHFLVYPLLLTTLGSFCCKKICFVHAAGAAVIFRWIRNQTVPWSPAVFPLKTPNLPPHTPRCHRAIHDASVAACGETRETIGTSETIYFSLSHFMAREQSQGCASCSPLRKASRQPRTLSQI